VILVDTSVWIDHLHRSDPRLAGLLERGEVVTHPMVIGELALGSLHERDRFLSLLSNLPDVASATHAEVMVLVEERSLHETGLSLVDAHLLASTLVTPSTLLWTRDRRLSGVAERLGVAAGR